MRDLLQITPKILSSRPRGVARRSRRDPMEAFSLGSQVAASSESRRRVLRGAAATLTAGLLPLRAAAQIKESGVTLTEFMALSQRLTEAADLSAELGRLYLESLQRRSPGAIDREALLANPRTILKLWYT